MKSRSTLQRSATTKRIGDGFRAFAPHGLHLVARFQIIVAAVHPHALWIGDDGVRLDAQQDVLRGRVFRAQVMRVVRRDERQVEFARERDQFLAQPGEFRDAVLLQFDVKAVLERPL